MLIDWLPASKRSAVASKVMQEATSTDTPSWELGSRIRGVKVAHRCQVGGSGEIHANRWCHWPGALSKKSHRQAIMEIVVTARARLQQRSKTPVQTYSPEYKSTETPRSVSMKCLARMRRTSAALCRRVTSFASSGSEVESLPA